MPHYQHGDASGDAPTETTGLLNGGRANGGDGPIDWKHFFFHSRSTPGTDHPNHVVRYTASTWHVTKVTLLSSKYSTAVMGAMRRDGLVELG